MSVPTSERVYTILLDLLAEQYGVEIAYRFKGETEIRYASKKAARARREGRMP